MPGILDIICCTASFFRIPVSVVCRIYSSSKENCLNYGHPWRTDIDAGNGMLQVAPKAFFVLPQKKLMLCLKCH